MFFDVSANDFCGKGSYNSKNSCFPEFNRFARTFSVLLWVLNLTNQYGKFGILAHDM